MEKTTLLIVGAGFSGTALAILCCEQNKFDNIILVEKVIANEFRGLAYGKNSLTYLLNVKAFNMGIHSSNENEFYEWLNSKYPNKYIGQDFVPRKFYGDYLEEKIKPLIESKKIQIVRDEILDINEEWATGRKDKYNFDKVVLTIGGNYIPPEIPSDVLSMNVVNIKGSGLSAVDVIVDLHERGFSGVINCYSRRGLLPLVHGEKDGSFHAPSGLMDLFKAIKNEVRSNQDNQYIVHHLRPNLEKIWNSFSLKEKSQFKRYLKPFWEIFRHRMCHHHHQIINKLISEKKLNVNKISQINPKSFINCTGFDSDNKTPLFLNLVEKKWIKRDPFRWGVKSEHSSLFILGPLQRFDKFEITSVRDIRLEALKLSISL